MGEIWYGGNLYTMREENEKLDWNHSDCYPYIVNH